MNNVLGKVIKNYHTRSSMSRIRDIAIILSYLTKMSNLVGIWTLQSCEHLILETKKKLYPFGSNPIGQLIYHPNGYMSVSIMNKDRKAPSGPNIFEMTDKERIELTQGFIAYSGPYEMDGNKVIHTVEACFFPNWIGQKHDRFWDLKGETLTLSTRPFPSSEGDQTAHLIWNRLK